MQRRIGIGENLRKFGERLMIGGVGTLVVGKTYESVSNSSISDISKDSIEFFTAGGYTILGGALLAAAGAFTEFIEYTRSGGESQ